MRAAGAGPAPAGSLPGLLQGPTRRAAPARLRSTADGTAGRLDTSEDLNPADLNPAVAEALEKVAAAMAVAEETAAKLDTLPSARLPTVVSLIP
jgi:hypothetical protein